MYTRLNCGTYCIYIKIKVNLVRSCSKEQESLQLKVLSSNMDRAEIDAFERPLLEERRGVFF
jgi:hypothetical protein